MDDRAPVGAQHDAGCAEVVEALGEADVLVPTAKPTPRDALATRRVARAAGQPARIARASASASGTGQRGRLADDLGDGQRPRDALPGRQHVAGRHRVAQPQLDGIHPELGGEPVHLRLGAEARLHRAEAAHRTARRVVRVDDRALDQRIGTAYGPGAKAQALETTAAELEA